MARQGNDPHLGEFGYKALSRLKPIEFRHGQVHNDDVGLKLAGLLEDFLAVGCFADDLHLGMIIDEQLETVANDLVVIGQKNANSLHTGSPIAANRALKRKANEDGCTGFRGGFNFQGAPD